MTEKNKIPKESELAKNELEKKIAGEIVLSENPGDTIKKWRNIIKISQKDLADAINIMPSVISDYESGRRKSPGIQMIKKIVSSMLSIEEKRGGNIIKEFSPSSNLIINAILDMKEFAEPVSIRKFCKVIKGVSVNVVDLNKKINGYTVIDSLSAIINFSANELVKLYGQTTERALIFTKISTGRSPMVAIKVTSLRPNLIVFHGIDAVDEIARKIADIENIPLIISREKSIDDLIRNLRKSFV